MGNKTLCCSTSDEFRSTSKMSLQQQNAVKSQIQGCSISVNQGRLLNQTVDTVVLLVNTKLKLPKEMEDSIRKFGGSTVMNELKQVKFEEGGKLELGQVFYTHAGDMEYEYIFYTVLANTHDATMIMPKGSYLMENSCQYNPSESLQEGLKLQMEGCQIITDKLVDSQQTHERQTIYQSIINCLQLAVQLGIKSIAFPFMGPCSYIPDSKAVSIMLFAIKQFLLEYDNTSLDSIVISTSQDNKLYHMFKYSLESISQRKTTVTQTVTDSTTDKRHRSTIQNKKWKDSESSLDDSELQYDQCLKTDNLLKFCNHYEPGNLQNSKLKSSF